MGVTSLVDSGGASLLITRSIRESIEFEEVFSLPYKTTSRIKIVSNEKDYNTR